VSDGRWNTTRKQCPVCRRPVRATESTATIHGDGLGLRHFRCVYRVEEQRGQA
jgi:hypothetical protein